MSLKLKTFENHWLSLQFMTICMSITRIIESSKFQLKYHTCWCLCQGSCSGSTCCPGWNRGPWRWRYASCCCVAPCGGPLVLLLGGEPGEWATTAEPAQEAQKETDNSHTTRGAMMDDDEVAEPEDPRELRYRGGAAQDSSLSAWSNHR